ncbi:MAG: hypothetical protein ACKVU0_20205 [Saprospiraceae bacterium]
MKKLIFLNFVLALSLVFQFCTKDENVLNSNDSQVDLTKKATDRSNCTGCNLQVIANMAGNLSTIPWLFELHYINSSGNPQVLSAYANGTTNYSVTIQEGSTQEWEFTGGGNGGTVVNVSARLSCGGDGGKIAGPVIAYTVPINTPWGDFHEIDYSTNDDCDVEPL